MRYYCVVDEEGKGYIVAGKRYGDRYGRSHAPLLATNLPLVRNLEAEVWFAQHSNNEVYRHVMLMQKTPDETHGPNPHAKRVFKGDVLEALDVFNTYAALLEE